MGIIEEARAQMEAARRAEAQKQETARREQQIRELAAQQRQQASLRQQELNNSQAISKFRALNPESFLRRLRDEAWHCGEILRDPSNRFYSEVLKRKRLDGVVLLYQSNTISSHNTSKGYDRGTTQQDLYAGGSDTYPGPSEVRKGRGSFTTETFEYPLDAAAIYLDINEYSHASNKLAVEVAEYEGRLTVRKRKWGSFGGFFDSNPEMSDHIDTYYFERKSFPIDEVKPQDILSFFVKTTAMRMQGRGHLKIS